MIKFISFISSYIQVGRDTSIYIGPM